MEGIAMHPAGPAAQRKVGGILCFAIEHHLALGGARAGCGGRGNLGAIVEPGGARVRVDEQDGHVIPVRSRRRASVKLRHHNT